jgi:Flp pilus assembly protein TadG
MMRRSKKRRGVVTVEFALMSPLLAAIVLGTFEVGRQMMVKQMLTETARAGCRVAILPASDSALVRAAINTVLTKRGIDPTAVTTTIRVNDVLTDARNAKRNDRIEVEVAIPFSAVSWTNGFFFISADAIQSEKVVMMREG